MAVTGLDHHHSVLQLVRHLGKRALFAMIAVALWGVLQDHIIIVVLLVLNVRLGPVHRQTILFW